MSCDDDTLFQIAALLFIWCDYRLVNQLQDINTSLLIFRVVWCKNLALKVGDDARSFHKSIRNAVCASCLKANNNPAA